MCRETFALLHREELECRLEHTHNPTMSLQLSQLINCRSKEARPSKTGFGKLGRGTNSVGEFTQDTIIITAAANIVLV